MGGKQQEKGGRNGSLLCSTIEASDYYAIAFTHSSDSRTLNLTALSCQENVAYGSILDWIKISRFKKDTEVRKKLSATWAEFPGIVPMLWRALGAPGAASAA